MKKIIFFASIVLCLSSCKQNQVEQIEFEEIVVDTSVVGETYKGENSTIDSAVIKKLKPLFRQKTDEFSEDKTTWITPIESAKYRNMNGIYCYFSSNNLRFVFQYHADSWLFINKCQFLIDGVAFEYVPSNLKRDNDESGITEWYDDPLDENNKKILVALSNAKSVKVKLIGDNYVDYMIISKKKLGSIKNTLDYYKALGNNF
ncbi:hypothetical protein FQU23_015250 [Flavobacterium sp. XN-5]|uniref:membrane lipoprotein lipid attachment site-containing protein n=1 Tax=Flavobacterium sp. XN-5 TaxID=2599390 RepID=UPI0011CADCA8|nr:membrane lipoprotein lipid attachment site-containing protein [Flavobacterium sp. XN-5]NGY38859.1 hypothetical protein [Flavobacterium sp. XN-5]